MKIIITVFLIFCYCFGIWPSGKATIFDVVSEGSRPSIPKVFYLISIYSNVLGAYFMEYR